MKLFNKRPLGLVLFILLSGFSLFAIGNTLFKIAMLCIAVSLCLISFVFKIFSGILPKIACFALLFSFVLSHIYFNYIFYPSEYYGEKTKIVAKIENVDVKTDTFSVLDLKTRSIGGKDEEYLMKLNLYGYHDNVDVGTVIELECELMEFEADADFDFKSFYSARGFTATADATDFEVKSVEEESVLYRFSKIRSSITERAIQLSPFSAKPF